MKKTKFYDIHNMLKAKMVEFAGYLMPIQYSSIIAEHKAVRNSVGVFDVSHMGEIFVTGQRALDFVQHITVNDASKLFDGRIQYSAMCYPDGGIVDDLLVYRLSETEFMLVVNASNLEKDFKHMNDNNHFGVSIIDKSDEYSLLAVQGPNSRKVMESVFNLEFGFEYYHFTKIDYKGVEIIVSRTGYTGELGYELYFIGDEETAKVIWNAVFEAGKEFNILPTGLGCRDSLRLEMGYCLYGNDIDATTNPLEAGLGWITKINKGEFIGKEALIKVKLEGLKRKLVAVTTDAKVFPRHGYDIKVNNAFVGKVTSGTVSPMSEKAIAMAYIDEPNTKEGMEVNFLIRNSEIAAKIVKLPFYIVAK